MAANSAFSNAFGATPLGGVLGYAPSDPTQAPRAGLLPASSLLQSTVGVLGILPGDPASLFSASLNALRAFGYGLGDPTLLGRLNPDSSTGPPPAPSPAAAPLAPVGAAPAVQPPPSLASLPSATAAPTIDAGALTAFDPSQRITLDPTYRVRPGDNLSTIGGQYVAAGLYPDVRTAAGALIRANGLSSSKVLTGQALTVPTSAAPGDDWIGGQAIGADARALAQRAHAAAAANGASGLTPRLPAGGANGNAGPGGNAGSMYGPTPAHMRGNGAAARSPGSDWRSMVRYGLRTMFAPEVDAYENLIVRPFWGGLSAISDSPLGDPGTYATLQSAFPTTGVVDQVLGAGAKGLSRLTGAAKIALQDSTIEDAALDDADEVLTDGGEDRQVEPYKPRNSQYAGQAYRFNNLRPVLQTKYPDGVRFTPEGFPDFSPYAIRTVKPGNLTGAYAKDRALANEAAKLDRQPAGYSWHHVEDRKTMLLIPADLHKAVGHTGGVFFIKSGG